MFAALIKKDLMNTPIRIVPAQGIPIPEENLTELTEGASELLELIDDLQSEPDCRELSPDVEIFYNAVQYAIEQDIFYDEEDVPNAALLLKQGKKRAEQLLAGAADWTVEPGLVVRGYRSKLDDSIQPYGMVVPESFDVLHERKHRLDIWHHGRNAKGTELRFLVERQKNPGQFTPDDTFVLHTYGRYSNAMKFAGEVDTFEALEHAKVHYSVDENRVCMRGFSMGGAATWHQATHYAGEWVAATPGAGFAETAVYQNVVARDAQPPWWEQKLWGLYDATKYAGNLHQCPTIAYSGENDKQMQSSDIMAEYMAKEGLELPHIIGPGMGHAYDDESKAEIERRLVPIVEKGRDLAPKSIHFTTYTVRYNRMLWVRIDGLKKHWERSRVDAEIVDNTIQISTENIAALTVDMSKGLCPIQPGIEPEILIDGVSLKGDAVASDGSWSIHLILSNGGWTIGGPGTELRKAHGLQGPIDDAFLESFLMVTPTGDPLANEAVTEWIRDEQKDALYQWKMQFRGDARVRLDTQVGDSDIANHNLIVWGDPGSNALLAGISADLPVRWDSENIRVGDTIYSSESNVPVLVYPNPLNPARYVVLNSGFTFAPNGSASNATQTPKLPDWAILDINVSAEDRVQKGVVDCDFFDEKWGIVKR
jgi:dienelactone hydrolase